MAKQFKPWIPLDGKLTKQTFGEHLLEVMIDRVIHKAAKDLGYKPASK